MSGIVLYAILSGLQPSIVRATIMAIYMFSVQLMVDAGLYGLFLAGVGMLL